MIWKLELNSLTKAGINPDDIIGKNFVEIAAQSAAPRRSHQKTDKGVGDIYHELISKFIDELEDWTEDERRPDVRAPKLSHLYIEPNQLKELLDNYGKGSKQH